MTKTFTFTSLSAVLFSVLLLAICSTSVQAQSANHISRVAITADQSNTSIWISDFPVNTPVMILDADNNLLSIVTTNRFGAAYTQLNTSVTCKITARTMNGDINVSNKAAIKTDQSQQYIAKSEQDTPNRA